MFQWQHEHGSTWFYLNTRPSGSVLPAILLPTLSQRVQSDCRWFSCSEEMVGLFTLVNIMCAPDSSTHSGDVWLCGGGLCNHCPKSTNPSVHSGGSMRSEVVELHTSSNRVHPPICLTVRIWAGCLKYRWPNTDWTFTTVQTLRHDILMHAQ